MGNTAIVPAPEDDVFDMMMGMVSRVASYRNYRNSLGYSFLYYVRDMLNEHNIKFLSIDGKEPTNENIASGAYPYADDFYAVTVKRDGGFLNADRTDNINAFIRWILSEQGQYIVKATGYVPKN
jgi:phosphate transport system substrate-binding protein